MVSDEGEKCILAPFVQNNPDVAVHARGPEVGIARTIDTVHR